LVVEAEAVEPLDKTHPVPQMLADHTVEPMAVVVVELAVFLITEADTVLRAQFALSGPAVLAHSHQLVREIYK
jgi:hypothetical protein